MTTTDTTTRTARRSVLGFVFIRPGLHVRNDRHGRWEVRRGRDWDNRTEWIVWLANVPVSRPFRTVAQARRWADGAATRLSEFARRD